MATVTYNPFEPGFTDDPYPALRALRESEGVVQTEFGVWVVFRYDEVVRLLRDASLSVEQRHAHPTPLDDLLEQALGEGGRRTPENMLNTDPPDHTRLRKLVSKAFTPRMVGRLRDRVAELVDESLDRAAATGSMEVIDELAFPLPFQVITELLGMPDTDTEQLRAWTSLLVRSLEPVLDPDTLRAIAVAGDEFEAHLRGVIEWKRAHLDDDLLSALITAEEQGDVLSDTELVNQVALLYVAGHETTVNLIGNGMLALLRHPDQLARWRAEPGLDANAVEELLRFDPPVQNTRRITRTEIEVGGRTIEPGAFVVLALASANRDAQRWGPTADQVDLARPDASHHVAFGGGHHYCLGASLAKLEAQLALGRLVRRYEVIEAAAEPEWNGRINLRGLQRLSLSVRERA